MMADNEIQGLADRVSNRIQEIAAAQKSLKRASVLSLVERRSLAASLPQAHARLEELRSGRTGGPAPEAESGAPEGSGEAPGGRIAEVESALGEAEAALARVAEATHPAARTAGPRAGWRPGERRG